jgi:uncharacterized protein
MKTSRSRSFLLTIIFFVCLVAPEAAHAAEKHFLWRATTNSSTVYLLGSVHFMKKDVYPLAGVIEEAFERCETLAVEADITNIAPGTFQALRQAAFYAPGDSIVNHVSGQTYAYIAEEAAGLGLPAGAINRQRPWFLGIMMSSLELMRLGYDPNYGIDKHFLTQATGKKKIVELESLDYQINLLAGLPDGEQESFLLYTVKDLKSLGEQVDALMDAWGTGNSRAIASILTKSIENDDGLKAVYGKIMTDRNRNMARKIATYLRSGGRVFVVVSAGHLVGDNGIIELLRKEGYRIDQL